MLEELKKKVYEANMELPRYGLVTFTWGNASAIDRESGYFVIKPSGVDYDRLRPEDMVVMDLNMNRIEGDLNPSSDTATHCELYKAFPEIGGIVHTHSSWATSWAQAGRSIPCYGTTHADYIYGEIPCLRNLTEEELKDYETNTGKLIAEHFKNLDVTAVPCCLCKNHGPFAWGKDAAEAVHNSRGPGGGGEDGRPQRNDQSPGSPGPPVSAGQTLLQKTRSQRLLRPGP